jgi:membrane fusion protein (multidrug efflux system)
MAAKEEKISIFKRILGRKKLLIIILVLIIGGFLVYRFIIQRNGEVETAEVKRGEVVEELILSGEIDADEYAQLALPASGKIAWVAVSEGDWVKKGQALTKLDTTTLNTTFQQARATLRAAEAALENVHDQVKDNDEDETFAQKDTRTAAEVTKDKAYEAYVAAEYNLRNSTLLSPFAGLITFLAHPFSGVNVLFSETQVEVINPETIYFDVSADQSEVIDLHVGQKVSVVLDSISDEEIEGIIDFISYTPKSEETGTVYKIKVDFLRDGFDTSVYRIGMTGDAKFVLSEKEDILYLPPKFVNSDSKGKFVRKGKKNNKVYVEVGLEGEERVEIIGDVEEGDVIFD